jgi:hypothetical protein
MFRVDIGLAIRHHQQQPRRASHPHDVAQHQQRRFGRPVQIIQHHHDWMFGTQGGQP